MQRRGVSRGCRGASRCRESSHARRSHYVVPVARGLGSVEGRRGVSRGGVEGGRGCVEGVSRPGRHARLE